MFKLWFLELCDQAGLLNADTDFFILILVAGVR